MGDGRETVCSVVYWTSEMERLGNLCACVCVVGIIGVAANHVRDIYPSEVPNERMG